MMTATTLPVTGQYIEPGLPRVQMWTRELNARVVALTDGTSGPIAARVARKNFWGQVEYLYRVGGNWYTDNQLTFAGNAAMPRAGWEIRELGLKHARRHGESRSAWKARTAALTAARLRDTTPDAVAA